MNLFILKNMFLYCYLSTAHSLSNMCTKNYWNRATTVKIIVRGWVVYFFQTQCMSEILYAEIDK